MPLVPHRFLFRVAHLCRYVADMPLDDGDDLLDLPDDARLDNFADMDEGPHFADVRLAWNERGLGLQVTVRGKDKQPTADVARPRISDGISLWIDTRDARASHRASRNCHQFHLLPTGGGDDKDEPIVVQSKINRASEDAPHNAEEVLLHRGRVKNGYRLDAFLPAAVLNGFDPEQHPRLGVFYAVRDAELGEQTLSIDSDFPYGEDPSLWEVLELVRRAP